MSVRDTEPPTFGDCPWCHGRKTVELGVIDTQCDECGFTGRCSNCGDPVDPDDTPPDAPQACSYTCRAEMNEQAAADERLSDRHL